MDNPTFKALVDATGRGQVWINGIEVSENVVGFNARCDVNQMNRVTVHLMGMDLDLNIDGQAQTVEAGGSNG